MFCLLGARSQIEPGWDEQVLEKFKICISMINYSQSSIIPLISIQQHPPHVCHHLGHMCLYFCLYLCQRISSSLSSSWSSVYSVKGGSANSDEGLWSSSSWRQPRDNQHPCLELRYVKVRLFQHFHPAKIRRAARKYESCRCSAVRLKRA